MLNILLLGSGGREHALAWKISQSPLLNHLYIAPGNPGTAGCGTNLEIGIMNFPAIADAVIRFDIHMLIVGPEEPLVKGITDYFSNTPGLAEIPVIGPGSAGAALEGSKDFAKEFMKRNGIPTAAFQTFSRDILGMGIEFLKTLRPPYVLKADGLAAGKGVIITPDLKEATDILSEMLIENKFGSASDKVVIEEYLEGIEVSVFVLTDGQSWLLLPEAKDYKRIGNNDTGPNTGGMGSVSPVPFADSSFMKKTEERIIRPTIQGLLNEGISYRGFIFFGLMNVNGEPYVIEYNCRLGDPETESILPRIESDLVELFLAASNQTLGQCEIKISNTPAATVMLVSGGYPGEYQKGKVIHGLETTKDCLCFHAGTLFSQDGERILSNGGRVIAVTAMDKSMNGALEKCYRNIRRIEFDGMNFRSDIGADLCL